MRAFNFDNIAPSNTEGGNSIPAGVYACKVVGAEDVPAREYVLLSREVAEGDQAGRAFKYYASYKESAAGMLAQRLNALASSNPGFDAKAAWNAAQLGLFRGRRVGVRFDEEEWRGDDGQVRVNAKPGDFVDLALLAGGRAKPPRRRTIDGRWVDLEEARAADAARDAAPAAAAYADPYGDIPFC